MSETAFVESGHRRLLIVLRLKLGRRHVPDWAEQPPHVEPVHPLQRRKLHGLETAPGPLSSDHLRLVERDTDSASALSNASPWLPTDGAMPALARRSVYRIERYWVPRS